MTEALRVAGDMLTVVPEMLVEYRRLIHDGLETSLTQGLALEARRSAEWARTIDPRPRIAESGRAGAGPDTASGGGRHLGSSMALSLKRSWTDPELEVYRDTVVRFIETEMLPHDEEARKRGHVGHAIWRRAGELGFLCADIPEAVRRRRRRLPPRGGVLRGDGAPRPHRHEHLGARIVAHYLLNHGTEAQKQRYLPRLARGELVGAIAMTEPGAGSDLQGVRTRAERDGDHYVINGSKTFITNGFLAGLVLVVVQDRSRRRAPRGMSILIVETEGCAGLPRRPRARQDRPEGAGHLRAVLRRRERAGRPPARRRRGPGLLPADARPAVRAPDHRRRSALAAMEGAYEATLEYVRERKAFGQPIADFQNTRFKLAEVATQIKVGRAFIDRCVEQLVAGTLDTATASMAKLWASETQGRVIDECCSSTAATAT